LLTLFGPFLIVQNLEVQTFGSDKSTPVLFLHGGPGYNSVSFERTTAQELAENGFFVISYDRRGEGRNTHLKAAYTFKQTYKDIRQIYTTYDLKKKTLIGHSFGGIVGTLFADQYPKK
jgi:proline iminopeptidase